MCYMLSISTCSHVTGGCGPEFCSGAPLTPGACINLSGTHFGFDINKVVDSGLQPLMIQPEALTVRGEGINWLLSQESEGAGGQRQHACARRWRVSVHVTFDHSLAFLMRTM